MTRSRQRSPEANSITEGVIWRQLLIFFFPILLGTFFQQLYNTADAMIVGKYVGKEALAAVGGATGVLINLLVGFFVGLSSGATVLISQFYGARREKDVGDAVHTAAALALLGGAGGDFAPQARKLGADVYLTGEIAHHKAWDAYQEGMCVLEAGHAATELPAISMLAGALQIGPDGVKWNVRVHVSEAEMFR